jgi:hypothetical protein
MKIAVVVAAVVESSGAVEVVVAVAVIMLICIRFVSHCSFLATVNNFIFFAVHVQCMLSLLGFVDGRQSQVDHRQVSLVRICG